MFDQQNVFENVDETGAFEETSFQAPGLPPARAATAGTGASPSPDGIGAYAQPIHEPQAFEQPGEGAPVPMGPSTNWGMQPYAGIDGQLPFEPDDTSQAAAITSAGFTALLIAVAVGGGIAVGGGYGAGAGALLAGALANGYRAQKWWGSADPGEKHEAVVSGVFSAVGVGVGGYLAYKAYQARRD